MLLKTCGLIPMIFLFGNALCSAQSPSVREADSLFVNGNYSRAISIYEDLESSAEVYDNIARAYMAIGNYDAALKYYRLNVEAHPDDALSKYEYARLLSKTKHFDEAVSQFNDLMNIDYRNPNYHYEMGLALEQLKDSTAINRFQIAYDLDSSHQKAIFKIAKNHLQEGRFEASHFYIDKGLDTYANNVELISLKAQNYYHQKYYKKAKPWFLKLIALGESSEFIHEKLSLIHAELYEFEDAIAQRKLVLSYSPFDATSVFVIGTYYEQLEDYEQAENYYLTALNLKDKPLDFEYQKLGYVYNRQKKYGEAIAAFQRSLKENPDNFNSAFFLLSTKDVYYADVDSKIALYENFIDTYKDEKMFAGYGTIAKKRLKELKEEKFLDKKQ